MPLTKFEEQALAVFNAIEHNLHRIAEALESPRPWPVVTKEYSEIDE